MSNKFPPMPKSEFVSGFSENILDNFDLPSYNFTLFMVSDIDSAAGDVYNKDKRIVIAQSGVTSKVSIEDVNITSVQGLGLKNRTGTATQFTFTIKEAYSASLIDNIYLSSLELGISNYMKCPYYLELKFTGRSNDSSKPIEQNELSGKTWLYPIIITQIASTVTSSGAEYEVTAAPYHQVAQTDQYGIIDKALTINAGTIGEAIDEIKDALNQRQEEKYLSSQYKKDTFEFDVDEKIRDYSIVNVAHINEQSALTDAQKNNAEQKIEADPNKKTVHFDAKKSILSIIDELLSSSEEYQKNIKKSETPKGSEHDKDRSNTMKKLHRVETEAWIKEFDIGRGDYSRLFRYIVLPYETGTLMASPTETNLDYSDAKYSEYKRRKLLQKHYNYLFTGKNDQVINFDIKFNFAWFVNVPRQGGVFTDFVQTNIGRKFKPSYKEYTELKRKIAKYLSKIPTKDKVSKNDVEFERLRQEINNSELSIEDQASLELLLTRERNTRVPEANQTKLPESGSFVNAKNYTPTSRYASDATLSSAIKQYDSIGTVDRVIPLTYIETDPEIDLSNAVEGTDSGGRQFVNSIFTQAFAGQSGDLVNIELNIKGDPFWLSKPTITPGASTKLSKSSSDAKEYIPTPESHDSTMMENFILFTLRTPEEADENSGVRKANSHDNSYNGVYGVYKVDHSFSNGLFTQTLYCVRDPLIDVRKIQEK
jgi:hypothetical protein